MYPFTETEKVTRILGIESSCDETAAAVVVNGSQLVTNVIASQIDLHRKFGGVFPEAASRQHIIVIQEVVSEALKKAHLSLDDIDAIAVTRGPGLPGSLVVGMNTAKGLSLARNIPLIGINHLEGHIYSAWLREDEQKEYTQPEFPLLALLVSGGHTELILMESHLAYKRLGATLDDAAGEAFDKVARLIGLPYPGGPSIQQAAQQGNPEAFQFPRARLEGTWDFSFSGLKTAVLRVVKKIEENNKELPVNDLAAGFQQAVVDVLVDKTLQAAKVYQVKDVLLAGGVSANSLLRQEMVNKSEWPVYIPPLSLCTDNAAMISAAGYFHYLVKDFSPIDMDVLPNWALS